MRGPAEWVLERIKREKGGEEEKPERGFHSMKIVRTIIICAIKIASNGAELNDVENQTQALAKTAK